MVAGLIDADLGGGVVKKRVGLSGRGKRGGARTLIATNKGTRWFFVFGFEKSERSNISDSELDALQSLAADLLARTSGQLDLAVADGTLQEICHGDQS
ncbi:type II toxin-antitoxin system RelE/ParE family toxin [Burkholderia cepacia]